jgi:DinB superfamily
VSKTAPELEMVEFLLAMLDRGFHRAAWHGPNLLGSIRGLQAVEAIWRPAPGRHNIAEQVAHCAYWKYAVRRRISGEARGSFALKGSNWFPISDDLDPEGWKGLVDLLKVNHTELRNVVAELTPRELARSVGRHKIAVADLIHEVAAHDVYHAGQIGLLKRLRTGS